MQSTLYILLIVALVGFKTAYGCSCTPTNVYTATRQYSDIVQATISGSIPPLQPGVSSYIAKLTWVFQGCLGVNDRVGAVFNISTPSASGCDVHGLSAGSSWLLTGTTDAVNTLQVDECGASRPWSSLADKEVDFLGSVLNDCTGQCANSTRVHCFFEPCAGAKCEDSQNGAVCSDNYCGGCNAYWWKDDILECY